MRSVRTSAASHELEVQWGELVQRLVPCAERVRFTASGTEATHLALRLARAYTGKTKPVPFVGHFHGQHDAVAAGALSHYDGSLPAGIPAPLTGESLLRRGRAVQKDRDFVFSKYRP